MKDHIKELKCIGHYFSPQGAKGLKILTKQQMFSRLPILFAQIQAGNNSKSLKKLIKTINILVIHVKSIN